MIEERENLQLICTSDIYRTESNRQKSVYSQNFNACINMEGLNMAMMFEFKIDWEMNREELAAVRMNLMAKSVVIANKDCKICTRFYTLFDKI
jgi:hypothetical protein